MLRSMLCSTAMLIVWLSCLTSDIGIHLCRQELSSEDVQRYTQQFQHIQEITQLYEQEPDNFPKLINLLQQVCGICSSINSACKMFSNMHLEPCA